MKKRTESFFRVAVQLLQHIVVTIAAMKSGLKDRLLYLRRNDYHVVTIAAMKSGLKEQMRFITIRLPTVVTIAAMKRIKRPIKGMNNDCDRVPMEFPQATD